MGDRKMKVVRRCLVSLISTFVTQISIFTIHYLLPTASLPLLLFLSVVVLMGLAAVGRCCKRLLRTRASAPAFVFFNIVFSWGVYVAFVRKVVKLGVDFLVNIEFLMLVIGLCRMLSTDPGYVTNGSSCAPKLVENPVSVYEPHSEKVKSYDLKPYEFVAEDRVRFCTRCKAYVREFDHHCPAFGNCIGQKNHVLFIWLLTGFLCTEASYVACSLHYSAKLQVLGKNGHVSSVSTSLVISTMLFSLLQLPWQGIFLTWHIYCICYNIKTDEWINWKKYPDFHMIVNSEPGEIDFESNIRFRNSYDKGFIQNLREFLIKPYR